MILINVHVMIVLVTQEWVAQAEVEAMAAHGQEALAYDELATVHATTAEALARGEKPATENAKGPAPKVPVKPAKKSTTDEDDL